VPLGLLLMVRLIPPEILDEHRVAAAGIVSRLRASHQNDGPGPCKPG